MKNLALLIIILFTSCKTAKTATFTVLKDVTTKTVNCPDNGVCTIEFISHKKLVFKTDEFGHSYPVISEGTNTIFKYTYSRNLIPNTQDSNYTEIVYAELNKTITEISLTNKALQTAKLYFGRLCFCKGATGYYSIKNGTFKISNVTKNTLKIDFEFKITEVPQIISKISETVSLKSNTTN